MLMVTEEDRKASQRLARMTVRVMGDKDIGVGVMVGGDKENLYILTAAHVVRDSQKVELSFGSKGLRRQGTIYAYAPKGSGEADDLAIVSIPWKDVPSRKDIQVAYASWPRQEDSGDYNDQARGIFVSTVRSSVVDARRCIEKTEFFWDSYKYFKFLWIRYLDEAGLLF